MLPNRRKHKSERVKVCPACNREFEKSPKLSWAQWNAQMACSQSCGHTIPVGERIVARTVKGADCWLWIGPKDKDGYGTLTVINDGRRKTVRAHREAYSLWVGECPADMLIMHSCDNPSCVRPDHLKLGTTADNMRDKISKGRHRNQYGAC